MPATAAAAYTSQHCFAAKQLQGFCQQAAYEFKQQSKLRMLVCAALAARYMTSAVSAFCTLCVIAQLCAACM
jgi:hypothetical protein